MNSMFRATVAISLLVLLNPSATLADAFTWNGANGGKWEVIANWNQGDRQATRLPGSGDDVTLSVAQDQAQKKVLLGGPKTDDSGVKSLVVENISLEPDPQAAGKSITIESKNDISLDAKSQVVTASIAQGDAGSVTLTSESGKLTVAGKIQAGNSGNPQKGKGGSITLEAKGLISVTGSVVAGVSYNLDALPQGGKVDIESKSGNVEIKGKVESGPDSGKGAAGNVRIGSVDGDEVLIDHTVTAGDSAGNGGWTGGGVFIVTNKKGAQVKLGGACKIQAGEGSGKIATRFGDGGTVRITASKVTDQAGATITGGKGGLNGGKGGPIAFYPAAAEHEFEIDLKNGTYTAGAGGAGAGGGKGGAVVANGKSIVNGKNIVAGKDGAASQFDTTSTMGNVTAVSEISSTVLPGSSIRAGVIGLISNQGAQFVLQNLDENAIHADASVCIGGSDISNPSVFIDLSGNPAGENVLVTRPGGQITLRGTVHLDNGVDLADITEPDAIVSSLPCPCVEPPEEIFPLLTFEANSLLSWVALPYVQSYEVLAGLLSELPVGPGGMDEFCLSGLLVPSTSMIGVPPRGDGYWYLVRARNICGVGIYGFGGVAGVPEGERVSTTCD